MTAYKGSDLLIKCLADLGVKYVFGMGGHGNLAICDGLYRARDRVKGIIVHDESVGASAAGGFFRATGKPGVLFVTNGPGMMQAIPGLIEQAMQGNAIVVVAGDIPTAQWGYGAEEELDIHQDSDQTFLYRGFAKRIYHLSRPEQIPLVVARAFNAATTGRPGIALIDVPVDVQSKEIPAEIMERDYELRSHVCAAKPRGDREAVARAAALLAGAERPAIVCGVGAVVSDAVEEVEELARLLDAPVASCYLGQAIMGGDNPYYAGRVGGWGNKFANKATREADILITLGNKFDEDETGAWDLGDTYSMPRCKLIHVHVDPREIGKVYPTEVGIVGDPKSVLEDIIDEIRKTRKSFERGTKAKVAEAKAEYYREMAVYRESDSVPINPHRLVKELEDAFPKNGIQVGAAICARNYYGHVGARTAYLGYGMCLIGTLFAQAIGFAFGRPDRKIVSVEGDGGFLIHSSLLATAAEYKLPVTWIVVNNSSYGTVWGLQRQYYENRSILTEFKYDDGKVYAPDYAMMARSFHVKGIRVERPEEIRPALLEAFAHDGPSLVDVVVDRMFSSTPPTVSRCGWDKYYPSW